MASQIDFTGMGSALGLSGDNGENFVYHQLTARNGRSFLRLARATSGATTGLDFKNWTAIGTVTDGQTAVMRTRVRFRLPTVAPNVARCLWYTIGGPSLFQTCGVLIDTDRTLKCFVNTASGGPYSTGSASAAVPLGYSDSEGWVTADIEATIVASGATDSYTVDCDLTFADGSTESITHTTGPVSLGTPNLSGYGLFQVPTSSGFTTNWIGAIDLAEWIQIGASNADVAGMPALPPIATRIREVEIDAQGSNNGIAYSSGATFRSLRKWRRFTNVTGATRLTTTTQGQQSDFTHNGVARFGAAQTYGLKLVAQAASNAGAVSTFMVGGSPVAGLGTHGTAGTTDPKYVDLTARSAATFDALEVGVQSEVVASTYHCSKLQIEVIHDGAQWDPDELTLGGGYQQEWITWTGNGSDPRTLSGAAFRPQFALIFSPGTNVVVKAVSVTHGDTVVGATGVSTTDEFFGFTDDGLIVAGLLNTNTQAYRALLIRDDGSAIYDVSGDEPEITGYTFRFHAGSYGSAVSIPYNFGERAAMTAQLMIVMPGHNATTAFALYKTAEMPAGATTALSTTGVIDTTGLRIASFDANGFTLGSQVSTQVNTTDGIPPLWCIWGDDADLRALVNTRTIAAITSGISDSLTGSPVFKNYIFSFEEDDEAVAPTLLHAAHTRVAAAGTTATVSGFTVAAGSNRRLVAVGISYGTAGTRGITLDGVAMTLVADWNPHSNQRVSVYEATNPTAGTSSIVYTASTSVNAIALGVFHVSDTDGIREPAWASTGGAHLSPYYASRLNDLLVGMITGDPLDADTTLVPPTSPWVELWNDGAVSAPGSAVWRTGLADAEVACTWTETGGTDVNASVCLGFMPVRPAWDPHFISGKSNVAVVAPLRLDDAAFAGTSCASWANQTIAVTNSFVGLDDYGAEMIHRLATGPWRTGAAYMFAIAGPGELVATSPPTTVDDAYTTPFETVLVVAAAGILANDDSHGGGALTALLEDDVAVGTLALAADGSFTYTPPDGFEGVVTFTYRAVNSQGVGTLATVTITVAEDVGGRSFPMFGLGLGGSYRRKVRDAAPLGFWYLSDVRSGFATDEVVTGDAEPMTGDPINGRGMVPEWGLSTAFDGATQYVTLDWDALGLGVDDPHSIVALVRPAALGAQAAIVSGTATGLWLGLTAAGLPAFGKNGGTLATAASALEVGISYLLIGTYDGTNARLYVGAIEDGSAIVAAVVTPVTPLEVAGPTAVSIGPNGGADVYIGRGTAGEYFNGDVQGVALYGAALTTDQIGAIYEACLWCDVDDDVSDAAGLMIDHGIHDDRPTSRLAATGQCTFALDNSALNIALLEGFWSPGHANACPNFDRRTMVRVRISSESGASINGNFLGAIRDIDLTVREAFLETHLAAGDWFDEAARAPLVVLPAEVDIRADEALAIILDRMRNKPHELVLGTGSEVYPFALDNAQEERGSVMQEIDRIVKSEFGLGYMTGDGTFVFEARTDRTFVVDPSFTFGREELTDMQPGRSDGQVKNRVIVNVHPRRRDAAATTVLYLNDQPVQIDNGITTSIFLAFSDPTLRAQRVGGVDVVSPAPTTHYLINTAEDGSGTNVTTNAAITVAFRIAGSGAYLDVTNAYGQVVWFTFLTLIGRGLYDYQPIPVIDEDLERQDEEGVQEETIDMPYQGLASVGQAVGALVRQAYNQPPTRIKQLTFPLRASDVHELAGRTAEISQRVAVAERVSGVDGEYFIQAKRIDWAAGDNVTITIWLASASTESYWILDVDELDVSTRLAFG